MITKHIYLFAEYLKWNRYNDGRIRKTSIQSEKIWSRNEKISPDDFQSFSLCAAEVRQLCADGCA